MEKTGRRLQLVEGKERRDHDPMHMNIERGCDLQAACFQKGHEREAPVGAVEKRLEKEIRRQAQGPGTA
eukprot:1870963-Heterocapsa_arctica.AAC.1